MIPWDDEGRRRIEKHRAMRAGKDYFTDKAPLISLEQLDAARAAVRETGRKYMVCFSERLQSESAVYAGELIRQGAIGRVIQVLGMGPHGLVFRAGPLRRHPLRHRQPPDRAVPLLHRRDRCDGRREQDCELQPPRVSRARRFRRCDADRQQRRDRLFPGRLVHAGRAAFMGGRPDLHPRHRWVYRAAQESRCRPRGGRGPCLLGRREGGTYI